MLNRNQDIANSFGQRVEYYDRHAQLQKAIALNLTNLLPEMATPRILEIGCGTGFLTENILKKYPNGQFDITDLSDEMLRFCSNKYSADNTNFFTLDGDNLKDLDKYDLIVSSMAIQWLAEPLNALRTFSKIAPVYYATIGHKNFPEWRDSLTQNKVEDGILTPPKWPNILEEENRFETFDSAQHFLKSLKDIGAAKPRESYKSQSNIKKAMNHFDQNHKGQTTWHIVYGHEPLSR